MAETPESIGELPGDVSLVAEMAEVPELAVVQDGPRWTKPQMEGYSTVPALADVALQPIGLDQERGKLVLEGTIDTLPSHHRLVTRWLKVYVVYDIPGRKIAHATFTIRGQRLE